MSLLISKIDIGIYREISASVKDNKINPMIEDAQLLDLKPLLGERFYYDLVANVGNYSDLLNKKEYTHNGQTIESPGIKRVLIDFAFARYVMHGSQTDTPFGLVQKVGENSVAISRADKKEGYKHHQQIAMQYWSEVENYLNRNTALYPLWRQDTCATQRKGFRLNHITR